MPATKKKPVQAEAAPRERGSIKPIGDDSWGVRVYVGLDPITAKRKYAYETVHGTRREAEKVRTRILRELDSGKYIAPAKDTLEEFGPEWLKTKKDITNKTRAGYKLRLKLDVYPVVCVDPLKPGQKKQEIKTLGKKKLDAITTMDVQTAVNDMTERGLSSRTVRMTHSALSQLFDHAVLMELIEKNPAKKVKLPKRARAGSAATVISPEQTRVLFAATEGNRWHALWVLLCTAGLRPSEALALSWDDYDGHAVTITKGLEQDPDDHYRYHITGVKTESSIGRVPLFDAAKEALEEHRKIQLKDQMRGYIRQNPRNLIFCTKFGGVVDPNWTRIKFQKALKDAGLPRIRLYDQRHTHATHLFLAKVPAKVVQERLRHKTVAITMDTYTHVLAGMQEDAIADAERALGFGAKPKQPEVWEDEVAARRDTWEREVA